VEQLDQLEAEVVALIESLIFPAYAKLQSFLETEYMPQARKEAGIWVWPDGDKIYNLAIHFFTSLPLTGNPSRISLLSFHIIGNAHTTTSTQRRRCTTLAKRRLHASRAKWKQSRKKLAPPRRKISRRLWRGSKAILASTTLLVKAHCGSQCSNSSVDYLTF